MPVTREGLAMSLLQKLPDKVRGEGRCCTGAGDPLGTGASEGHSSGQRAETEVGVIREPWLGGESGESRPSDWGLIVAPQEACPMKCGSGAKEETEVPIPTRGKGTDGIISGTERRGGGEERHPLP